MAGYTVASLKVQDAELFGRYAREVPPLLQVVEWDSVETARQWYESDVYQPFRELRQQAATTKILLVQGAGSS